jgi:hypothetical protein
MSYLDRLLSGLKTVLVNGTVQTFQPGVNFLGGVTSANNPTLGTTDLTFSAGNPAIASAIYGDGSDGTATCDGTTSVAGMSISGGNYTLTRDVYFANLTTNVGVIVSPAGFRIFVSGTFTHNGRVSVDGVAGIITTGGSGGGGGQGGGHPATDGGGTGTRLRGGIDQSGGGAGGSPTNSFGGNGGASSFGTNGGTAAKPATGFGTPRDLFGALSATLFASNNTSVQLGGGAGGGGAGAANGGGGGGVMVVAASKLVGIGSFTANGGNGGANLAGPGTVIGAGGAGGGMILLTTRDVSAWTGVAQALGGNGAATTAGTGGNGTAGLVVTLSA